MPKQRVGQRSRKESLWTAATENRLIEMVRNQNTMEEMARELSLPLDEIENRITQLNLGDDLLGYD